MAISIRVLLINENGAKFTDIENTNEGINKALGWDDAWNTPTIRVDSHDFICICSDTGKLRHEPVSALSMNNLYSPKETLQEPFIVGAIIISKFDGIDDLKTLNAKDEAILTSRLMEHGKKSTMFNPCILVID